MPAPSWTRVGRRSGFWTRPCAGKTASSGGLTAAHPTPANPTGTAAGPGVGVSDAKQGPGGPPPEGRCKPSAPPGANDGDVRTGAVFLGEEELCLLDEFYSWFITMATIRGEVLQPGPCHHWLQDEGSLSALGQCSPWAPLPPHLRTLLVDTIPGTGVQEFSAMPSFLLTSKWKSTKGQRLKRKLKVLRRKDEKKQKKCRGYAWAWKQQDGKETERTAQCSRSAFQPPKTNSFSSDTQNASMVNKKTNMLIEKWAKTLPSALWKAKPGREGQDIAGWVPSPGGGPRRWLSALMEETHLKSHNTARGLCSGTLAKQACDTSSGKESQGHAELAADTRIIDPNAMSCRSAGLEDDERQRQRKRESQRGKKDEDTER
eukprot:bmy_15516T0